MLTCAFLAVSLASNARVYYVANPGVGNGNNSGDSWGNAAPDIQFVITPANYPINRVQFIQDGDTIFVAQGTYDHICLHFGGYNVNGTTINSSGLSKLHILGGFKGSETSLAQRTNWRSYPSIISPSNENKGNSKDGVDDKLFNDTITYQKPSHNIQEPITASTVYTAGSTIPLFNLPTASHVMLYDIQGRMLNRTFVVNNEFSMQTPNIPGLYIIVVENNGTIVNTTKIIVSK